MLNVFVASGLAFLLGLAIGIAGCFYTTIARFEKEIEEIFETTFNKYKRKVKQKDEENKRLHSSLLHLQIKLAKMKEERK